MTNGKDHAYYCKADGHVYLKDDGTKYSTVFVRDNGREAAEAEWYAKHGKDHSWKSGAWNSSWGSWSSPAYSRGGQEPGDAMPSSRNWPSSVYVREGQEPGDVVPSGKDEAAPQAKE